MKGNEDSLRDFWDNIKCTNIHIIRVPGGEEREKGPDKMFEEMTASSADIRKLPQHGKGNSQPRPRSTESPKQDKPKEKHTKTHSNQMDKN